MRKKWVPGLFPNAQQGGAAIEYILVSVFGLLLAIAAIGFVREAIKGRVGVLEEKLGITLDDSSLGLFSE